MNNNFANTLNQLRIERHLTSAELAQRANVSQSLICGLQKENRVVGEYAARKIGKALQLDGNALEEFVYLAINACSDKVLKSSKAYPAEVLNLLANELQLLGILPDNISRCIRHPKSDDADATICLNDGKMALINLEVALR